MEAVGGDEIIGKREKPEYFFFSFCLKLSLAVGTSLHWVQILTGNPFLHDPQLLNRGPGSCIL